MGYLSFYKLACKIKYIGSEHGVSTPVTWRTPVMFGNNSRNPLFGHEVLPYYLDFEELLKFYRDFDKRLMETILVFKTMGHSHLYHPQREDRDDMTIYDAEYVGDMEKRMEEQRHDMAIKCV